MRYLPGVEETSTDTTTGANGQTLSLSAVTGRPRFSSYSPATNELFPVTITDGTNLEMGWWEYSASNTIARAGLLMAWNGSAVSHTTAISWGSGTKTIICAPHTFQQAAPAYSANTALKCIWPVAEPRPSSTVAPSNSLVYMVEVNVDAPVLLSGLGVDITTAAANADPLNLAVYARGVDGEPGVRLAQISSTIAGNVGTGVRTASFSANLFLTPGKYFFALNYDYSSGTALAIRAYSSGTAQAGMLGNGNSSTNLTNSVNHLTVAGSGHALDAEYGAGGWTYVSGSATPCIVGIIA